MINDIVVFDVMTACLEYEDIIEFAAVRIHKNDQLKSCHFLIRPENEIPTDIMEMFGIQAEEFRLAGSLSEYRQEILDFFDDAVLVGYQSGHSLTNLGLKLKTQFKQPYWDTLELARIFFPTLHNYQLANLADQLSLTEASDGTILGRSEKNVLLIRGLFEACKKKGLEFDLSFFDHAKSFIESDSLRLFFEEIHHEISHRFSNRRIQTDMVLASAKSEGLFERQDTPKVNIPNSIDWVVRCFTPGGILEQMLPGYESRSGQVRMAKLVAEAFASEHHVVLEAGTGTGKSLAYLIPCIWSAKRIRQKVVVATHTIPLQEQLLKKDLPLLEAALPFQFRGSVLKGKNNYLCLKRWQSCIVNFREVPKGEQRLALLSILVWLRETLTGDIQELSKVPGLRQIWTSLSADNETCVPSKCPKSGVCFLLRARKKAEEADLVIVNHSLLFSDLKTDYKVIPEYHQLVIDEAHQIYQTALQHLGSEISQESVSRMVGNIYRVTGSSFYVMVKQRLGTLAQRIVSINWDSFEDILESVPRICQSILEQTGELFKFFLSILGTGRTFRFVESHTRELWWSAYLVQTENLMGRIKELVAVLESLSKVLIGEEAEEIEELRYVLMGYQRDLQELLDILSLVLRVENSKQVTWLELNSTLYLKTSPIDISNILKEKIFLRLQTVVLTSATLSMANSFEHYLHEIGLPVTTLTAQIESPFDYEEQMQFFVVKNGLNLCKSDEEKAFELAVFIKDVAERLNGRTLVLFTAHKFLGDTYAILKPKLDRLGIETLAQGPHGERSTLIEAFKKNPRSVLLGANSFWEGIDIPGDTLTCVIMVKLPFWPPFLPLIEARSEFLKAQERDPFNELLLPEAVIRFKQGFGRLIRTKGDRGIVILLDDRAIRKYYGKYFLGSLPIRTHIRGENGLVLRKIEEWKCREFNEELL